MNALLGFLEDLRRTGLRFRMERSRDQSVMVPFAIPGCYWEVEFFADDHVEVERFRSTGKIEDADTLDRLLAEYAG